MKLKILKFIYEIIINFNEKEGFQRANSLSYTILISFVPFLISIASIVSLFLSKASYVKVEKIILTETLPAIGDKIIGYMNSFHEYAGQLTLISTLFLFITTLLMIISLRHHLNKIWEAKENGINLISILMSFLIMVIGPLLLSIGILLTSYFASVINSPIIISSILPLVLSIAAFTVIYKFIPAVKVKFSKALISGVVAGILFEIAKLSFTVYVKHFATDGILYGALAILPIFLLWINISCVILLLGASINVLLN